MILRCIIGALVIAVPVLFAAGSKREASIDSPYGEWITIDYNRAASPPPARVICSIEGKLSAYPDLESKKPINTATFSVNDSWVDQQGNLYLKVNCNYEEPDSSHNTYDLWKIDSSGSVWEFNRNLTDFPKMIDPDDPSYIIFNRR